MIASHTFPDRIRREHIKADGSYRRRVVEILESGIRAVTIDRGESWSRYVIVPRRCALAGIRKLRAHGQALHNCEWWRWMPDGLLTYEHHGGPGQPFATAPVELRYGRRWLVFAQRGGVDC